MLFHAENNIGKIFHCSVAFYFKQFLKFIVIIFIYQRNSKHYLLLTLWQLCQHLSLIHIQMCIKRQHLGQMQIPQLYLCQGVNSQECFVPQFLKPIRYTFIHVKSFLVLAFSLFLYHQIYIHYLKYSLYFLSYIDSSFDDVPSPKFFFPPNNSFFWQMSVSCIGYCLFLKSHGLHSRIKLQTTW